MSFILKLIRFRNILKKFELEIETETITKKEFENENETIMKHNITIFGVIILTDTF